MFQFLRPTNLKVSVLLLAFTIGYHLNPAQKTVSRFPDITGVERDTVLLLTSHPDDESLFFGPTLSALLRSPPSTHDDNKNVYSICLSIGNADDLGEIRSAEYHASLDFWGIPKSNRLLVDHEDLQDNIHVLWKAEVVADVIKSFVLEHNISAILTFDDHGISGHPNHKAAKDGALHLIQTWTTTGGTAPPRLFSLISHSLLTKYLGIMIASFKKFGLTFHRVLYGIEVTVLTFLHSAGLSLQQERLRGETPVSLFVNGGLNYLNSLTAMRKHTSQMVWFRWLNVLSSRYMWVNEWEEVYLSA